LGRAVNQKYAGELKKTLLIVNLMAKLVCQDKRKQVASLFGG